MFNTSQLKLLRKSKGLTQEEVAETLSISQSAYARLENGVCKTWGIYLKSLCEIFSVSPIILLNDHSLKDYDILEEKENLINTLQNKISNLETTVSILNKK